MPPENKYNFDGLKWVIILIAPLLLYSFWSFEAYTSIGVGIFIFFCFQFFLNLGRKIEIRDIVILIASLQWIIGPILAYRYLPDKFMYSMTVPEHEYMSFVVPGVIFYIAGLYLPFYKTELKHDTIKVYTRELLQKYPNLDIFLILTGIIAGYVSRFFPSSLGFVFFLLSSVQYVGIFYLLLSKRKKKIMYVLFVLGSLVLSSVRQAMFSNTVLWLIFSLIVFSFIFEFSFKKKLIIVTCCLLAIYSLQVVKQQYRRLAWGGNVSSYEGSKLLAKMMLSKYTQEESELMKKYATYMLITRINQGWIIARIMKRVPEKEPFANGETIKRSILDSCVPRFLSPDKLQAGGAEYFSRFVGRKLAGTSMDLSVIGEAYANYGKGGGIVFMFFMGLLYNFILFFIYRAAKKNPSIFLWLPILFLFAIKAETGFYMVFNHLVKASVFLIIFFKIFNIIYKHHTMDSEDGR